MRQIFGELDRDRRIFEAEARRIASGHHRGARWRAGRVRGIGGGEIDAFACKRVDVRRLDDPRDAAAVEADIVIAEVVGDDQDDVRRALSLGNLRRALLPGDRAVWLNGIVPVLNYAGDAIFIRLEGPISARAGAYRKRPRLN